MKYSTLLLLWICSILLVNAQAKFKFGDVPKELLTMTVYEKDTTASAFVVYENQEVYYDYKDKSGFELMSDYTIRIKILTTEGVEQANGNILLFNVNNPTVTEEVNNLSGWTYNLENGKIVKEKLSKDYIFIENIDENWKRMKFALPAVKAGSVIEYRYSFKSPFYYFPRDYKFQRSIPVQYSFFKISIPDYFIFNREEKGYENVKKTISRTGMNFKIMGLPVLCSGEELKIEAVDLPALKNESFVWNYNDYRQGITFELRKINMDLRPQIDYTSHKDFTQSWDNVVKDLMDNDNFGKKLKNKGLFKDELATLQNTGNNEEKLRAILNLVRSKVKWNDLNQFSINNPDKALKDGVGTSSEINSLLYNAVKNAGFEVGAVAMSLRSKGRIPLTYPTRDRFNYFIVEVKSNGKTYYLDATRSYCDLNVIPIECLVDNALCIYEKSFDWVNLTKIGNNSSKVTILASFNDEGILIGKRSQTRAGESIFYFKQGYERAKDEAEHIQKIENSNDIAIADYKLETSQQSLIETYDFTSNSIRLGDANLITILPLLFDAMRSNPFKQEERKLPVEFNFPEDSRMTVNIFFPEGYTIDEAPKSERIMFGDNNELEFSFLIQVNENNNVQIVSRFKLDVCIIPPTQYAVLRDFYSKVYAKCQEVIVFKKK